MRLFWELARLAFQRQLTYRAATLAGLATNFFFGMLRASVLLALYGTRQQVAGISTDGAVTYTGLTQAVIAFLSLFSWREVMESVYSGQIGADLLKPMNYFGFWLAQDLGRALASLLLRGLTIMLAYALFFGITLPQTTGQMIGLAIALFLGWLVSFAWRFLINLSAFWTPNAFGVVRFGFILSWFFSGFFMPLPFFPSWFVRLAYLTPFPHMVNAIVEVYLERATGVALLGTLLAQALWAVALIGLGQWVLRRGVRRLVIQGG